MVNSAALLAGGGHLLHAERLVAGYAGNSLQRVSGDDIGADRSTGSLRTSGCWTVRRSHRGRRGHGDWLPRNSRRFRAWGLALRRSGRAGIYRGRCFGRSHGGGSERESSMFKHQPTEQTEQPKSHGQNGERGKDAKRSAGNALDEENETTHPNEKATIPGEVVQGRERIPFKTIGQGQFHCITRRRR